MIKLLEKLAAMRDSLGLHGKYIQAGICGEATEKLISLQAKLKSLTAQEPSADKIKLQAVCEIFNGMEGFKPKTAPEAYLLRIVRQMYHAAIGHVEQCTYPNCKCPVDLAHGIPCAKGSPLPTKAFGPTMAERGELP